MRLFAIFFTAVLIALPPAAKAAPKELVIGISQFPSNFNPLINSMLAKSYMLASPAGQSRFSIRMEPHLRNVQVVAGLSDWNRGV